MSINGEEIINEMKSQMEEYKNQYIELGKKIESVGREYQSKIDKLQQERQRLANEGNAKLEQLKLKREQVGGMHAALYNQCAKYMSKDVTTQNVNENSDTAELNNTDKELTSEEVSQSEGLSDAEKATLAKIVAPVRKDEKEKNDSEIPDFLKPEYKK